VPHPIVTPCNRDAGADNVRVHARIDDASHIRSSTGHFQFEVLVGLCERRRGVGQFFANTCQIRYASLLFCAAGNSKSASMRLFVGVGPGFVVMTPLGAAVINRKRRHLADIQAGQLLGCGRHQLCRIPAADGNGICRYAPQGSQPVDRVIGIAGAHGMKAQVWYGDLSSPVFVQVGECDIGHEEIAIDVQTWAVAYVANYPFFFPLSLCYTQVVCGNQINTLDPTGLRGN
jgi:hypothetical protein